MLKNLFAITKPIVKFESELRDTQPCFPVASSRSNQRTSKTHHIHPSNETNNNNNRAQNQTSSPQTESEEDEKETKIKWNDISTSSVCLPCFASPLLLLDCLLLQRYGEGGGKVRQAGRWNENPIPDSPLNWEIGKNFKRSPPSPMIAVPGILLKHFKTKFRYHSALLCSSTSFLLVFSFKNLVHAKQFQEFLAQRIPQNQKQQDRRRPLPSIFPHDFHAFTLHFFLEISRFSKLFTTKKLIRTFWRDMHVCNVKKVKRFLYLTFCVAVAI